MAADARGWFAAPAPVRELFKLFPLRVYPAEELPCRAPPLMRQRPSLYVFVAEEDAAGGWPSFNPSCLKWQTLLRIADVDVEIVPSNNHASPSGALPFLLQPTSPSSRRSNPLTGDKIYQYAKENTSIPLPPLSSPKMEAYEALLSQNLRPAWLHALYLLPTNYPLLANLYLPSSPILRRPIHHTLHTAATSEILKTTRRGTISPEQLYADATEALRALSTLLGDDEWFWGSDTPSLFDADVFSYTYLMLDDALPWRENRLAACLLDFQNLVRHRKRLYERCWERKH